MIPILDVKLESSDSLFDEKTRLKRVIEIRLANLDDSNPHKQEISAIFEQINNCKDQDYKLRDSLLKMAQRLINELPADRRASIICSRIISYIKSINTYSQYLKDEEFRLDSVVNAIILSKQTHTEFLLEGKNPDYDWPTEVLQLLNADLAKMRLFLSQIPSLEINEGIKVSNNIQAWINYILDTIDKYAFKAFEVIEYISQSHRSMPAPHQRIVPNCVSLIKQIPFVRDSFLDLKNEYSQVYVGEQSEL